MAATSAPLNGSKIARQHGTTEAIFAFLWASAHVVHAWHQGGNPLADPMQDPWLAAVLLAALGVATNPRSPHRLMVLSTAQVVAFAVQFPLVANHWTIAAFVNAGIVVSYIGIRISNNYSVGQLIPKSAPYARVVFIVSYTAAAIAKLNETFLGTVHSCALTTMEHVLDWAGIAAVVDAAPRTVVTWGVASIELAIPTLLLVPSLRRFGIALAAVFHLALASTPVVVVMDFTLVVLALCVLFMPRDIGSFLTNDVRALQVRHPKLVRQLRKARVPITILLVSTTILLAVGRGALVGSGAWAFLTWGVFLTYGILVVSVGLIALFSRHGKAVASEVIGSEGGVSAPYWVLIALLVINAASPYVGLKTTSSFTMFSNLHTEGGTTNHLLLPRFSVFSYQDDLVDIVGSSDSVLKERVRDDQLVTYHELRRRLGLAPDARVTFIREGELHFVEPTGEGHEIDPLSAWERKLLHFRPVAEDGTPICQP